MSVHTTRAAGRTLPRSGPSAVDSISRLGTDRLAAAYRLMRTIREFEERLHTEQATGDVPGPVHLYAGQEAIAVGVCMNLDADDYVTSTHRGHGHAIAKGCDLTAMMLEIFGKEGGLCGGKGGSMHVTDISVGLLGANGIAAGGVPVACGAALSAKLRGTRQVAVAFVGDGGVNQGVFQESLTLARIWRLPVVFVVEDNGYAQSTGSSFHLEGQDIALRAVSSGVRAATVDGYDLFDVADAAADAVRRARNGEGPSLLVCPAMRFLAHMEGLDRQLYRPDGEADQLREEHDCLRHFAAAVTSAGSLSAAELAAMDEQAAAAVDAAVRAARAAGPPAPRALATDVYVSY
jgi:acetoin:2,6-dichlorophenolindophenol oxidoreductase subunit alpha